MSFEEAQEYVSKRGLDIPWNDGDVFIDEREIMRTVGNVLKWADDTMAEKVITEKDINKIVHLAKVEFCRTCWCGIPRDTCTSLGTCDEHDNFVKAFRKQLMDNYYEMDKSRG